MAKNNSINNSCLEGITVSGGTIDMNSGSSATGISTDNVATTISIATGAAAKTVSIGSTSSTSSMALQSGSGAFTLTSTNGALTVNSGTGAIGVSTDASNTTLSIGTGSAVKTVTVGSTTSTSTTTITSGTGGVQVGTFLNLPTTSSTVGQIKINGTRFMHAYGTTSTFLGDSAGNLTHTGQGNTAVGANNAGASLTSGSYNTGVGRTSINQVTTGQGNTGVGVNAINGITTGNYNVGLGYTAGSSAVTGSESSNIWINSVGVNNESHVLRIGQGTSGTGERDLAKSFIHGIRGTTTTNADAIAVLIDSAGQLGTVSSSIRYKENVNDMGEVSAPLMKLRPVTFDFIGKPSHKKQVGLIAEEVAQVMPDLVVYNMDGLLESVKYHELPVLLLSEFQKTVRKLDDALLRIKLLEEKGA